MSLLEVNKITPQSGTTLTLGDSGDTINFGSGVLPNFENLTVTGDLTVDTNSLKVDSTNNYVGIGTASPDRPLKIISTSSSPIIEIQGSKGSGFEFGFGIDSNGGFLQQNGNTNLRSFVNGSERTRVTNSGDFLVGMTSPSVNNTGFYTLSAGGSSATRASGTPLNVNRQTNNGTIVSLRKDGTEIGILGVVSNDNLYITNPHSNTQKGIGIADDNIYPVDNTGNSTSNQLDIGDNSAKFKDLYLGGNAYASIVNINNASTQGRLNVSNNGAEQLEVFPGDVAGKVSLQAFNRSDTTYDSFRYIGLTHEFLISGTEKMRIDSSGNVGIGTSSPSYRLHVDGNDSTNPQLWLKQNNNGTGILRLTRQDAVDGQNGDWQLKHSSQGLFLQHSPQANSISSPSWADTLRIQGANNNYRITPGQDNVQDLGQSDTRWQDLFMAGNIYLGGTGSANALDDYEEGTFTVGNAGDSTGVIGDETGEYTKIGRMVYVRIVFRVTTNFSSYAISGLPYTVNVDNSISSWTPMITLTESDNDQQIIPKFAAGTTQIYFDKNNDNNNRHYPNTTNNLYRLSSWYITNA